VTSEPQPPVGEPEPDPVPVPNQLRGLPNGPRTVDRVLAELADVQVAHEELRVAQEEMRSQQEQITQLLLQHDAERRWRGQLSALLPVGLFVTDGNGTLVEANPALAGHLGTGLARLRGKPLSVYLAPEDVAGFRATLRDLASGAHTERRLSVTVRPRSLPPARTHLFGFAENADHRASLARVQWVLVPEDVGDRPEAAADGSAAAAPGDPPDADHGEHGEHGDRTIPASDVIGLAAALAELSSLPVGVDDRQRLLSRMAALVRGAVPGAEWVSITLGAPMDPQWLGSDSAEAQLFDGLQERAGEGPCWEGYTSGTVVSVDDVTADIRWPALARGAGAGAVRSVLSVPVQEDGAVTGVINVYSGRVAAFGAAGRRIGELTAAAVAGVLQSVAERESMQALAANLERALTSRAAIDQAKGMIMARLGVDADEAFARLVKLSSRLNIKVRDLAALMVEGHVDDVLHVAE
jgi:PAS domain-containing protein/putative methionine-R-sulfoxide reductase with GAF domain